MCVLLFFARAWYSVKGLTRSDWQLERAIVTVERQRHEKLPREALEEEEDGSHGGIHVMRTSDKKEERMLALADHKTIASLQSLLVSRASLVRHSTCIRPTAMATASSCLLASQTAIDNAYTSPSDSDLATESSRNLVAAVVGTLMAQATRDCRASKRNACIWGAESKKMLRLLYWIARRESHHDSEDRAAQVPSLAAPRLALLRPLTLQWLRGATDKTRQLTACYVLFELLQLHRHAIRSGTEPQSSILGSGDAVKFIRALSQVVDHGAVTVKSTSLGEHSGLLCGLTHMCTCRQREEADGAWSRGARDASYGVLRRCDPLDAIGSARGRVRCRKP